MSDNEWVPVNVRVLREAFEELVPLDETSATRTVDVSKKFLRASRSTKPARHARST